MAILFYDHLVSKNEIENYFSSFDEADSQRGKALQLIDDIIFQGIVIFILENLDDSHHQTFLTLIHERPYDPEIILYLRDRVGPSIEDDLRSEASRIVQVIIRDLSSS